MTAANTFRYGLRQVDEVEGSGVFRFFKLKRGESPAADSAVSVATAGVALGVAYNYVAPAVLAGLGSS